MEQEITRLAKERNDYQILLDKLKVEKEEREKKKKKKKEKNLKR